jgi:hypothetical protein
VQDDKILAQSRKDSQYWESPNTVEQALAACLNQGGDDAEDRQSEDETTPPPPKKKKAVKSNTMNNINPLTALAAKAKKAPAKRTATLRRRTSNTGAIPAVPANVSQVLNSALNGGEEDIFNPHVTPARQVRFNIPSAETPRSEQLQMHATPTPGARRLALLLSNSSAELDSPRILRRQPVSPVTAFGTPLGQPSMDDVLRAAREQCIEEGIEIGIRKERARIAMEARTSTSAPAILQIHLH